jgi:hypothetical protein
VLAGMALCVVLLCVRAVCEWCNRRKLKKNSPFAEGLDPRLSVKLTSGPRYLTDEINKIPFAKSPDPRLSTKLTSGPRYVTYEN